MVCWPIGNRAELYGWEHLGQPKPGIIVVCEGEFDRLVLESHGIRAVTGTAGAGVFLKEWGEALLEVSHIFVCYDRDEAGRAGAERVAVLIPQARIVELPTEVGPGGDITDFFVRLGKSIRDFEDLIEKARPLPEGQRKKAQLEAARRSGLGHLDHPDPRVRAIRENIPMAKVASQYVQGLMKSGSRLVGLCPFHDDHRPSLVLYPDEGRFHCYGCGTRGDVIQFLMEAECLRFPQALRVLEEYVQHRA